MHIARRRNNEKRWRWFSRWRCRCNLQLHLGYLYLEMLYVSHDVFHLDPREGKRNVTSYISWGKHFICQWTHCSEPKACFKGEGPDQSEREKGPNVKRVLSLALFLMITLDHCCLWCDCMCFVCVFQLMKTQLKQKWKREKKRKAVYFCFPLSLSLLLLPFI